MFNASPSRRAEHPSGLFLDVPADWEVVIDPGADPGAEVALVALEPEWPSGAGFRASHVVTIDLLPQGMTLRKWQLQADALLAETLTGYRLLDLEHHVVEGLPALRRLATYRLDDRALTLMQVAVIGPASARELPEVRGVTLSSTAHTMALPALYEQMDAVGASLSGLGVVGGASRS